MKLKIWCILFPCFVLISDSVAKLRHSTTGGSDTSDSESSEGSYDDDDAPLSTLMNPKRPGSALSHASRGGPQQQQRKPLIDLNIKHNALTGKPIDDTSNGKDGEKKGGHLRPLLISPTDINNRLSRLTAEAGLGNYHKSAASKSEDNLGRRSGTASPQPLSDKSSSSASSPPVQNPSPVDKDTPKSPVLSTKNERKSSLPPSSPSSFMTATTSSPTIAGHESQILDDDISLRPIPIKERNEHHGGFRVVSRPRKSPSLGSPISNPQSPSEPQRSSQFLQQSMSSLAQPSGSPSKESQKASPTKYPPRSSSFMVTSRPLSGGSSDLQISPPSQTSKVKSQDSPSGIINGRSPPTPMHTSAQRPFAQTKRRDSPASSTGGSSNGKAPLTPMDGSDYFSPDVRGSGSSPSGSSIGPPSAMKGGRGHVKRGSVTFQEPANLSIEVERGRKTSFPSNKGEELSLEAIEIRRKERRRGEAKAAIDV